MIDTFLAAVRDRLRRRQLFGGAATWSTATLGGALLLLMSAAALGPSGVWRVLAIGGILAAAVLAGVGMRRVRLAFASDDAVARWVWREAPAVGEELLSAVELRREKPRVEDGRLSPELVDALEKRVADSLARVEPRRLVDTRRERKRAALGLAGVAVGYALALGLAPNALRRGWAHLFAPRFEQVTTASEPIVGDLKLELRYPAYTGLTPRVIPASSGQVVALPGTEVRIEARALVPATAARLELEQDGVPVEEPQKVEAQGPLLRAAFVAKKPGSYRFVLDGPAGRVREPEAHRIDLEQDRPPRVDLFAPAEVLEVAGPRRIELAFSVDDDYGLGPVELVWRVGEAQEQRKLVRAQQPASERSAAGKFEWDLAELDLKPGARVAYHLEAKDNDDVSGPNVGSSRTFYLTMFSPHEKHEAALAEEERVIELALGQLADRLEQRRDLADNDAFDAFNRIHGGAEALLTQLARSEQALDDDKQATGDLKKELREIHARLGKLSSEEEALLSSLREKRRLNQLKAASKPLEAQNGKFVPELERDIIALDDLLGKQRLEELLHVGDEMARTRDRLKQLLADYKKTRSEALRKEIERELRDLGKKLAELAEKSRKLASELPDQFLNPEAMGKNSMGDQLDKIRQMLEQGNVDQAMAELEKMSSQLDQMIASMEQDLKGFRSERFSAEEKAMAEAENKLSDLSHDEQQIKQETSEVRQRARAEAQRRMREQMQPLTKKAKEQVAQLKKHLDGIEPRALSPYDQEELGRIKQRTDDLGKMLDAQDLDEARGMARQASQGLTGLDADMRDEEARAWHPPRPGEKKAREHVAEGGKLARQIADELDQALPKPGDLMSPDDQRKMGELAERQKAAKKRAGELSREMKGPALPQQLGDGLRDAGQHMERAEGELRKRASRDAEGEEQQALDQLQKMKEQLQRQRRPRDQMAGGGNLDKEPVKIPGADDYKPPKEFRQDLLEAMKRAAPSEYKEQVKRYYEELVK